MLILFCLLLFLIYLPQPEKKRVEADLNDCAKNLKQVYQALLMYQEKYEVFPHEPDTKGLNYLFKLNFDRDLTHFVCPGTETQTRGELRDDTLLSSGKRDSETAGFDHCGSSGESSRR